MKPGIDKTWQRAVVRLLDGQMSESERTEWEKRLLRHPEAHALLREYQRQDEHLAEALREALGGDASVPRPALAAGIVRRQVEGASAAASPRRRPRGPAWVAAAAAVVLVAGAAWLAWGPGQGPKPGPTLAEHRNSPIAERHPAAPVACPADSRVPAGPAIPPTQIRRIDRFHVDVFDEQTGEVRRWSIDREQIEPRVTYVGL